MATNFLHAAGTNGFIVTPFALFPNVASFDTLTNTSTVTSTGVFNQASFGNAQMGLIWFIVGDVAFTPTAGGNLTGWWIHSTDGGTTYENTDYNVAIPRAPDFIVPFTAAALSTSDVIFAQGIVPLPWDTVKVYVQNNSGVTMGNTTTTHAQMFCGPVADQY